MSLIRDVGAAGFIIFTVPVTIYHSVQIAQKHKVDGGSDPHVEKVNWYLRGGWFADDGVYFQ